MPDYLVTKTIEIKEQVVVRDAESGDAAIRAAQTDAESMFSEVDRQTTDWDCIVNPAPEVTPTVETIPNADVVEASVKPDPSPVDISQEQAHVDATTAPVTAPVTEAATEVAPASPAPQQTVTQAADPAAESLQTGTNSDTVQH